MTVFSAPNYDGHEHVVFGHDAETGLRAIIAVHNTHLGPAVGGCRMGPYADDMAALRDALRLLRGMTYKSALAGLPFGGGKSVIIGDAKSEKSPELIQAMGGHGRNGNVTGTSETSGNPSPYTACGVLRGIEAGVEHKLQRNDGFESAQIAIQCLGAVGSGLAR